MRRFYVKLIDNILADLIRFLHMISIKLKRIEIINRLSKYRVIIIITGATMNKLRP